MKKAFTLAEVLITLGIIGVVAAMTLPALVNQTRGKELETALQKAYSILQQSLQQMQYDTGLIPNNANFGSKQGGTAAGTGGGTFIDYFRPYFLSHGNCKTRGCIKQSYTDEEGNTILETKKYKNYTNTANISTNLLDDGQMILSDGMLVLIENYQSNILITIDVNGIGKKPNRWGHDLFTFQIEESSGKLLPMGANNTQYTYNATYCSSSSTNSYNGIGCTYKALTEKDYFKNLPK